MEFGQGTQEQEKTAIRAKSGELLARIQFEKDKVIFREGHDGTDAYVLETGRVTLQGDSAALAGDPRIVEMYLGRASPTMGG